jgi:hypothetical protein
MFLKGLKNVKAVCSSVRMCVGDVVPSKREVSRAEPPSNPVDKNVCRRKDIPLSPTASSSPNSPVAKCVLGRSPADIHTCVLQNDTIGQLRAAILRDSSYTMMQNLGSKVGSAIAAATAAAASSSSVAYTEAAVKRAPLSNLETRFKVCLEPALQRVAYYTCMCANGVCWVRKEEQKPYAIFVSPFGR